MINVAHIKYYDREQFEEIRGWKAFDFSVPGIVVFMWSDSTSVVRKEFGNQYIVTLARVENIYVQTEEE